MSRAFGPLKPPGPVEHPWPPICHSWTVLPCHYGSYSSNWSEQLRHNIAVKCSELQCIWGGFPDNLIIICLVVLVEPNKVLCTHKNILWSILSYPEITPSNIRMTEMFIHFVTSPTSKSSQPPFAVTLLDKPRLCRVLPSPYLLFSRQMSRRSGCSTSAET